MYKTIKIISMITLGLSTQIMALNEGFNFGECSGSGSFEQQINYYDDDYENAITVGEIPKGIQGLKISLKSDKDVDIRLYAGADKIVHWPYGSLNNADKESETYKNVLVTYSGYNGVNGNKGDEYIEVKGTVPQTMIMKAFGYKAGYATVTYSWTGKEGCTAGGTGKGSFNQEIKKEQTITVGEIPSTIKDLYVSLNSDKDLDIQLYGENGTAIVSWKPTGLISGANKQNVTYHGMHIEWSGYYGDGTGRGHEYIKITGKTTEKLTMKAYGYNAGLATVTYIWDVNNTQQNDAYQKLMNTLSYMGNEERLAYDVYNKLFDIWGTKQFTNIANNSEIRHIQAVQELVQTYKVNDMNFTNVDLAPLGYHHTEVEDMKAGVYDISKIQKLYDDLITTGSVSEKEALKVGCIVEVVDVDDLDEYIDLAEKAKATDIIDTFTFLRRGSYNHYWAFDRGLKNRGFNKGCCTWTELCHPEYPENGNGNGHGNN